MGNDLPVEVMEALVQYLAVPLAILVWQHNKRLAEHSTTLRVLEALRESDRERTKSERSDDLRVLERLAEALERLDRRLGQVEIEASHVNDRAKSQEQG